MSTTNVNIRGVNRSLRDGFKAACVRKGKNMKDVMIEFMRNYVRKDGKLNKRD